MWRELLPVGRYDAGGGYRRHAWNSADAECRAWFAEQARARGLALEVDRNGNQWAWWGDPAAGDAVVTGSHLDSVPDGGAYDGPLGVVAALTAVDVLRERGRRPARPVGVVNFADEEGARFGVACTGSRLAAGALAPDRARALTDADGVRLGDAMERAGHDPYAIGPDATRLARIGAFVELHIEQGRHLGDHPVGVAAAIWPHGRWRFDFHGEANHAGTTRLADRRDPMLGYAAAVLAAREQARRRGSLATFGRVAVQPGGTNAIASLVRGWLDCRAPDEATLDATVAAIHRAAEEQTAPERVRVAVERESYTPVVDFDGPLRDRLAGVIGAATGREVPVLPTGAGHDAGILSAAVPTAMLFVRNPTGVSHSPYEAAEEPDCLAGAAALADVLEELACS
ncbi:allantoate amidohydrolase [Streptomyces sp. NPDC092296]|uniref:allantoate amidohydrolase n=1 Tax=Streptomyces sp. NPDC092296 TaxID=3366012 RepID=UPI0038057BEB